MHVSEVAQHIGGIAAKGDGQVLVNESGDRDASLLMTVPAGTVAEISGFLDERAERVGSELSIWENDDKVLVNVSLELSDDQAVALRSEVEGHLRATDLLAVFVVWVMAAGIIFLVAMVISTLMDERRARLSSV